MDNGNLYLWIGFGAVVLILLALDLGVFHRKAHAVSTREAAIWTVIWIALALIFNLAILAINGSQPALEYLAGYLIEKSLSVDNIFVFVVVFSSFCVLPKYQHKLLFWGILGALIMRGIFIAGGSVLMERFSWITYIFGAFLVYTGIKIGTNKSEAQHHPENNPIVRLAKRFLPVASDSHDGRFFIRKAGKLLITPLFLALLTVEFTDLVFALDSIPAIFAITTDPFIIFTSNIFAILGLRSLYFLLSGVIGRFYYLHTSLAIILVFVGVKMLIAHFYKLPIAISLSVIVFTLLAGVVASLIRDRRQKGKTEPLENPACVLDKD